MFCRKRGARNLTVHRVGRPSGSCRAGGLPLSTIASYCGSWLVQSGVALADVKEVCGHSTIRMTSGMRTTRRRTVGQQSTGYRAVQKCATDDIGGLGSALILEVFVGGTGIEPWLPRVKVALYR